MYLASQPSMLILLEIISVRRLSRWQGVEEGGTFYKRLCLYKYKQIVVPLLHTFLLPYRPPFTRVMSMLEMAPRFVGLVHCTKAFGAPRAVNIYVSGGELAILKACVRQLAPQGSLMAPVN